MPELTDAQKVMRNDTGKRMAAALEALAGTGGRGLPAGGTDGDVLVKNGATDYDAIWKKTPPQMASLATIEPTSSASKAYAAGDYLVYNGQLYKVGSTAISQGQTLTPGGNIEAATATSLISGDYIAPSMSSKCTLQVGGFIRYGDLVLVNMRVSVDSALSAGDTIASGFPSYAGSNAVNVTCGASIVGKLYPIYITPAGSLFINDSSPSGTTLIMFSLYSVKLGY